MAFALSGDIVAVARFGRAAEARDGALVLAAAGISSELSTDPSGFVLAVSTDEFEAARRELEAFRAENRSTAPAAAGTWRSEQVTAAMGYLAVLVIAFVISFRQPFGFDFLRAGAADAARIAGGEWWRTITALTLHADLGHLASNVVAGGIFGILLSSLVGIGIAWFAILAAGALGNAANALFHVDGFSAIGASTAAFAALGLLAAMAWRSRVVLGAMTGLRVWAPLAGGLMLLVFLGLGDDSGRIDIGGHVAGFLSGVVLGAGLHALGPRIPQGRRTQAAFGIAALGAVIAAWAIAIVAAA